MRTIFHRSLALSSISRMSFFVEAKDVLNYHVKHIDLGRKIKKSIETRCLSLKTIQV